MRRQGSLEKTVMLGKIEGSRKRERIKMRWADSIKEAIGFRAGVLRTGHCGHHSFIHSFTHGAARTGLHRTHTQPGTVSG